MTKLKRWRKLSCKTVDENPFWQYRQDEFQIGDKSGTYYYVHTGGSVFIVPLTAEGELLMVRQYRYLNDRFSIEFPGGGVKDGENPDAIAEKELIEETGYRGELTKIGVFNPYNGVTDEITSVYIATNLAPSDQFKKDDTEEFELLRLTPPQLGKAIADGSIYDGMTLAAWMLACPAIEKKTG